MVHVSLADLQKIVWEIVDNAIKFSREGTPIQITGWQEDAQYILSVQDYGRGMSDEHLGKIGAYQQFDRKFYEQQGTGLGLTIARGLIEIHDGTLVIESEPEQFTKVEIRLRMAEE